MRVPNSYSFSLDLWRRLRGSGQLRVGGPNSSAINSSVPKTGVPAETTPWLSSFLGDIVGAYTATTMPAMAAKAGSTCSKGTPPSEPKAGKPICPSECAKAPPCGDKNADDEDEDPNYENMTMQEFALTNPDEALNPRRRPTFWPHRPEDQLPADKNHNRRCNKSADANAGRKSSH